MASPKDMTDDELRQERASLGKEWDGCMAGRNPLTAKLLNRLDEIEGEISRRWALRNDPRLSME